MGRIGVSRQTRCLPCSASQKGCIAFEKTSLSPSLKEKNSPPAAWRGEALKNDSQGNRILGTLLPLPSAFPNNPKDYFMQERERTVKLFFHFGLKAFDFMVVLKGRLLILLSE